MASSTVIQKIIEARQAARKAKQDAPIESEKLAIDREKMEGEADERLIRALMEEREKTSSRYELRIAAVEQQMKDERSLWDAERQKYQEKFLTLAQTRAEDQMQIQMLTRQVSNLETRIEKGSQSG